MMMVMMFRVKVEIDCLVIRSLVFNGNYIVMNCLIYRLIIVYDDVILDNC